LKPSLLPIEEIAQKLGVPSNRYEKRSSLSAKLSLKLLEQDSPNPDGKLILVTATTPTVAGEGKTVTSIGLAQGFEKIGKRAIVTSREPSLGPVFGMKGGASGGGRSQVEPAVQINLHFHGDFHAITSAHNLLAALIDSHVFHGNELDLQPDAITWPRTLDMNDRALRRITVAVTDPNTKGREGSNRSSGFVITAASEIMAILALASDRADLRRRLARIVVGQNRKGQPVCAADLEATGPMMALLSEALLPNLVQTSEGTPATVHCGPFANIAHGTSSIVSQRMGIRLAEYVVNETGFASDLGLQKYMDLVSPSSGTEPAAAVLVTTVQSLKQQGEGRLERGFANLEKHLAIVRGYGLPVVIAINRFPTDGDDEIATVRSFCEAHRTASAVSEAFTKGGEGSAALAREVVQVVEANPNPKLTRTYQPNDSAIDKITKVATKVYGAEGIELSPLAKENLERFARWGFGQLPICIAKTQYSLSDDPKRLGAPTGWTLHISDVKLSAGAGFLVVVSGTMMLMPGLPKLSRALAIDVNDDGDVVGLE
jgi:formate--tetrahydrofolate ligase